MMKPVAKVGAHVKTTGVIGALALAAVLVLPACQTKPPEPLSPDQQLVDETAEQEPTCPEQSEREIEKQAIELLDRGESEEARRLLDCVIADNQRAWRAKSLLRQLDADPVSYLGARHYLYTVQSSETLSKIAGERLGDPLAFVILARYNDIPVPANLVAGQRIKVPGEEPTESSTTEDEGPAADEPPDDVAPAAEPPQPSPPPPTDQAYTDALALEKQGDLVGAYRALEQVKAADPQHPNIDDDLTRVRQSLIASLEDQAYDLELAGDVSKAIATWQQLLQIDPRNIPAQLSLKRLNQ